MGSAVDQAYLCLKKDFFPISLRSREDLSGESSMSGSMTIEDSILSGKDLSGVVVEA